MAITNNQSNWDTFYPTQSSGNPDANMYFTNLDPKWETAPKLGSYNQISGGPSFWEGVLGAEATAQGPSNMARSQYALQKAEQQKAMDDSNKASAGQYAQAIEQMAMRGGLRSGARERLAGQASGQALMSGQNIRREGAEQRLGIGAADEMARRQILGSLTELAKQRETERAAFELDKYRSAMGAWAGKQQADAIEKQAKEEEESSLLDAFAFWKW